MNKYISILIFLLLFVSFKDCCGYNIENQEGMDDFTFSSDNVLLVTEVKGTVEIYPGGGDERVLLKTGDTISLKDILKTEEESKVKLLFSDGSVLKIAPDSSCELNTCEDGIELKVSSGKIWSNIRSDRKNKIVFVTDSAGFRIKGGEFELEASNKETILTVSSGEGEFSNSSGFVSVKEKTRYSATSGKAPSEVKKISEDEMKFTWANFGNPRVMVVIEELNLDKPNLVSAMESAINSALSDAYYYLVDPVQINTIRQSDEAKKGVAGDLLSAATLGKRLQSDIIIIGKVETEYVGEMQTSQNKIITSQARCDIRVVISDTAQIILAKKLTEKGTSLSSESAGMKAIEKIAREISKELVWEIPVKYTVVSNSHRAIQLVITDCNFASRDRIIQYLKTIPCVGEKVYPRSFENSIAILDVE
ncbi:MAG TPA: FecR domain-containing protein, partial [Candidatus Eremiobacteraeota bacterium]|nr:FecR domain-containing protein [Candidatus Eremiobacteraeota bacterium]